VIEDGKLLFAYDFARAITLRTADHYFREAIETIRKNRRNYARRRPADVGEVVKPGFPVE